MVQIKFVTDLYKVKRVVLTNAIKLELPNTIKIYPVVNISRVQLYKPQVEDQKVVPLQLVVIDRYKGTTLSLTPNVLVVAHQSNPELIK